MINIQALDAKVINKITYKRFTTYLERHGWIKQVDDEIEEWWLGNKKVTVMPSSNYPNYLSMMRQNLQVIADVLGQPQVFIVAALLGKVKTVVEGKEVIYWKEWSLDSDVAEMKITVYKDPGFLPYEDGDKIIQGVSIEM